MKTISLFSRYVVAAVLAAGCTLPALADEDEGMRNIPAGVLPREDGDPQSIAAFQLASRELTRAEWSAVRTWALNNGYDFGPGTGETPQHPVSTITWYDAVKFCNAASELAGLTPVYYTSARHDEVYRQGELDLPDDAVKVDAYGYRLPTQWEWEYACRAGTTTPYWYGRHSEPHPGNPYAWHTDFMAGGEHVSPRPVGLKKPNPFGLYDMSGNVAEWCWDRYCDKAAWRVQRGGSVALDSDVTSGFRSPVPPGYRIYDAGLRLARSARPPLAAVLAAQGMKAPARTEPLRPQYNGTDPAEVAAQLVSLLNPGYPGVQKVVALQKAGQPVEALEAYRDFYLARIRAGEPANEDSADGSRIKALNEYLAEQERVALEDKLKFDNLDNAGRAEPISASWTAPTSWRWGMGYAGAATKTMGELRTRILALPREPGADRQVSARPFANLVIFFATDDITRPIKDPRNAIGNQQVSVAKTLVEVARLLPEMRDAPAWEALGMQRIEQGAVPRYILPDGGDLEQSFHYNDFLFSTYEDIAGLFEASRTPDWVKQLHRSGILRRRMFNALRLSSGARPAVGNASYGRFLHVNNQKAAPGSTFYDPLAERIGARMVLNDTERFPPPGFTSVAFPYSGYYLMRNGWDADSSSLFFKSSRPGAGHNHPDNNGIELSAYGRHLLVDRESPPYGPGHLEWLDQEHDYLWVLEYKGEDARWTANNLLIDNCIQVAGRHTTGYETTIDDQPWYTAEHFDFVQGHWTRQFTGPRPMDADAVRRHAEQYGASKQEIASQMAAVERHNAEPRQQFEATHTRQVLYLRQPNAWIVTDWAQREDEEPARELTQKWLFPSPRLDHNHWSFGSKHGGFSPLRPGFEKEHVRADKNAQRVLTANPENVNLAMLHAVPGGVNYTVYFGDKYPWRGWANHRASMSSGYVPAVDLHATFPAGAPLVTVLIPIPQGQTYEQRVAAFTKDFGNGQTRVSLRFTDGTEVQYAVGHDGPVRVADVEAEVIVTMTSDGATRGLATPRTGDRFAFTIADGKPRRTAAITVPGNFKWTDTPNGPVPAYR